MNQPIYNEWKVRKPVLKMNHKTGNCYRPKCPNCGDRQLMRYYSGPIDLYCYVCSWKSMR